MKMFRLFKKKYMEVHPKPNVPTVQNTYVVVAKSLSGHDADSMYGRIEDNPGLCPYCRSKLRMVPNFNYHMKKKRCDLYYTYDGFCIVSENFKQFCELNKYVGLSFTKLGNGNYYYFEPGLLFETNIYWSPFISLNYWCDVCKNFAFISGEPLKKDSFVLRTDDFICRTRMWGCSYEKHPIIIIGLETEKKMKLFGLRGIYTYDVYG